MSSVAPNRPPEAARALSREQLQAYGANGYLVLRSVFSEVEMAAADAEAKALFGRRDLMHVDNIRCRWQNHIETDECLFDCFDPVIDLGVVCGQLALDRRILDPLAAIYGDEPCLFKDKLIFKPPGARGYGLHQDYISWASFPTSFTTVLIAIDPADAENGATEVYSGYHLQGYLSPRDGEYHELPADSVDLARRVVLDLRPGDVAMFSGLTPHRSSANHSRRWRRQLYLSYNAFGEGGEQREQHYREFHVWLREKYAQYGKHQVYFR